MLDFYRTVGGQRFVEGTVPRLIEAIERLAKAVEKANELKEREGEDDLTEPSGEGA